MSAETEALPAPGPTAVTAEVPPAARARSAFWPTFWMAVIMFLAKASHWSLPDSTEKRLHEYVRDLAVSAHADLLFCVAVGLLAELLLWMARRRPTLSFLAYSAYAVFCFVCVLYTLASVQIFAYLRSPLTYALLYLANDMDTMSSSIGQFLSGPFAAAMILGPILWILAVRFCERRFPLPRTPLARGLQAIAIGALLCVIQIADETENGRWRDRDDRRIAQNPHWTLVSSYAKEMVSPDHSGGFVLSFPPEYLKEFEPVKPSRLTSRVALGGGRRPRNVILVVLESVGTHYLSLYGSRFKTTPNLEAEAAHALVFENFHCHVGMTANSLAAISLSLWPYMTWREYTQDHPTLPGTMLSALFTDRGYRTGFVHNGHLDYTNQRAFLTNRGFETLWDFDDLSNGEEPTSSWGGEDKLAVDGIFRFVDQEPARPFYVMAWTSATHHPYEPGKHLESELENFFEGQEEPFDAWNTNRYLNLVKEADRQLGRLFEGLRERGLDQDTLVVITGDHGESFGEPHSTWGHGSRLYDEFVKVPFYVWAPRLVLKGRRLKTVGSHVDVNPTIADLVGLPVDPSWHGRSLFDRTRSPRAYFYAAHDDYRLGVREGERKYVYNATTGGDQLFDLATDPQEQQNLAPQFPAECLKLRQRVAAWREYVRRELEARKAPRPRLPLPPRADARPVDRPRP
jgi:arylsulfatase A-like enzyme